MEISLLSFEDVDIEVALDGSGPPLVFIHGYACTHDLWRQQFTHFSSAWRCVAYDLRGHGGSSAPATGYGIQDHTRDVLRVMDSLQIPSACLIGMSMGGGIALSAALDHPGRVNRLVLASSTLGGLPWEEAMWSYFRGFETQAREVGVQLAVDRVWMKGPLFHGIRRFPALQGRVRQMAERFSGANIFDRASYPRPAVSDRDRLGQVACPTLVLRGELDPPEFIRRSNLLAEGIPGARLEVIADSGHFVNLEAAPAFNRAVADFLREG